MGAGDVGGRAPAPIGREAEHAAGVALLDAASRGPAALVLSGPAGIGKTTIWRALLTDAGRRGYRTMSTRAVEAEAQLAFGGLADLLDPSLDEVLVQLPQAQRDALEVALQRVPAGGIDPPPLAVSLGTLGVLRTLAEESPVILAVDDLQWLDGSSARVLEYALRRVGDARVGFVPTVRTDLPDVALPPAATAFDGPLERLHVGPLDLHAVDEIIRRELGLSLRRPALAWIHGESGGNPFLALELARTMQRGGFQRGLEGLPSSTSAGDLVRERLGALASSTRLPLAAAAALGRPSVDLVVAAIQGAGSALDAARDAGVIELDGGRVRFTHPLLAAGAYALLEEAERRDLHRRLAETAVDPEQRARHLALATEGPSEAVAAELDRAALHARARGSSDAAAELELEAARRTPGDDPAGSARRIITASGYLIRAGDPTRARAVLEEHVAAAPPGPGRADALRVLADARSSDDWRAKIEILDQALAEAGDDHRLRGEVLQALSQATWVTAGSARAQLDLAAAAVAEAEAQDDPMARCSAYLTAVFARLNAGEGLAEDLLAKAEALAPLVEHERVFLWPATTRGVTDLTCDRLERAVATFRDLRDRAISSGDWDSLPTISTNLALVSFRLGDWRQGHRYAVEAERGFRQNGQAQGLAWALVVRATIEAASGELPAARRAAAESQRLAEGVGARLAELDARTALGFVALCAGDHRAAAAELGVALDDLITQGYLDPSPLRALPDWAESLVALDRAEEVADRLDSYERAARRLDRPSARAAALRVRGLIATGAGDEQAAEEAFEAALAQHDRIPEPFERGRTLLARGEALRRFRRRGRAREALAAAVGIFETLGAGPWLERSRAELARTGHREAGASFTATERQVAELVAAGRTNREVAETLFMSPHTVEAHLTRVYRSLGVRGRTELARAMAAQPIEDADGPGSGPDEGHG